TLANIAKDVFFLVSKFIFLADFVIVDYESDPRVPLILGRPFLRTARALIDVHCKEMILHDGDERLTLNIRHDTSSYSNQPQKESIKLINVFNDSSEDFLEDLFLTNQPSGNPTFSSHPELTSPKVQNDIFDLQVGNVLLEKLLDLDSTKDLYPPLHVNPLSGSTTSSPDLIEVFLENLGRQCSTEKLLDLDSSNDLHPPRHVNPLSGSTSSSFSPNQLLEEFADELALITFPPGNNDLQFDIESNLKEIEYLLHHDPIKDIDSILK
nr:reverse transcriptase domain-containing protein [Tanacetum cinerariifolium]